VTLATALGLAAGGTQALAYLIYARQMLCGECRPNGMTWLMWTYGTVVFFLIEADTGAPLSVLLLPGICTACSVYVAAESFRRASYVAPDRQDWAILGLDGAILLGYLALAYGPWPTPELALLFVLLPGISATLQSWPILRTTCLEPRHERPLAWFVWSAAYALMALAAVADGLSWHYLVYPALSLPVHVLIGVFAAAGRQSRDPAAAGPVGDASAP
jgi:hypothetical protein